MRFAIVQRDTPCPLCAGFRVQGLGFSGEGYLVSVVCGVEGPHAARAEGLLHGCSHAQLVSEAALV